jgi:hypothetical protein
MFDGKSYDDLPSQSRDLGVRPPVHAAAMQEPLADDISDPRLW